MRRAGYRLRYNVLYYKKCKGNIKPIDYVVWAYSMLEKEYFSPSLSILASLKEPLNLFEVEQFFERAKRELGLTEPTYEESVGDYVQYLIQQILLDKQKAIEIAYEIYTILRDHNNDEKTYRWYEISEMIDDFQYGDNVNNITQDMLIKIILQEAEKQLERD